MLDTVREVETPEGVTLHLRVAGVVPRAMAWGLDGLIRLFIFSMASAVLSVLGRPGSGLLLISAFLLLWFYWVLFEALMGGRTPGKILLNLRVLSANGTPVGWMASLIRNLLRTVDMFPLLYGFGAVAVLLDRDFRRLGDRVAGTVVVHDSRGQQTGAVPKATPVPPRIPLKESEQVAVAAFAERVPRLTEERQQELADIVEPLTGLRGGLGVQRLLSYANWIIGRR